MILLQDDNTTGDPSFSDDHFYRDMHIGVSLAGFAGCHW